jgi:hypothetical protein
MARLVARVAFMSEVNGAVSKMSDTDPDVLSALANYRKQLDYAGDRFASEPTIGVQAAVNATIELLLSLPSLSSPERLAPLRALLDAFSDTDKGVVPPLFAPSARNGRPVDPTSLHTMRAQAAAAMHLLMKCFHYSKNKAARLVAHELTGLGISIGNKHNAAKTVASWRDRVAQESRSDNYDAMVFYDLIEHVTPLVNARLKQGENLATVKNDLLATLQDLCGRLGPPLRAKRNLSNPQF